MARTTETRPMTELILTYEDYVTEIRKNSDGEDEEFSERKSFVKVIPISDIAFMNIGRWNSNILLTNGESISLDNEVTIAYR